MLAFRSAARHKRHRTCGRQGWGERMSGTAARRRARRRTRHKTWRHRGSRSRTTDRARSPPSNSVARPREFRTQSCVKATPLSTRRQVRSHEPLTVDRPTQPACRTYAYAGQSCRALYMGWGYAPQVSIRCFYPLPRLSREERGFVREVFERMVVEGPELASITPKALYSPLFVLDRRERFGGDFCSMAPRAGFEPTT